MKAPTDHEFQAELDALPDALAGRVLNAYEKAPCRANPSAVARREGFDAIVVSERDRMEGKAPNAGFDLERFTRIATVASEFLARTIPPPSSILGDGIMESGDLAFLAGTPGVGKSFLEIQLARALSLPEPFFGLEVAKPLRVGILMLEGHAYRHQKRMRALFADGKSPDRISLITRPDLRDVVSLTERGVVEALMHWIDRDKLEFLILDPLKNLHSLNENDNTDMATVTAALDRIRYGTGCGLLVAHHESTKTTADTRAREDIAALRGASRLGDDANAVLRLMRDRGLKKLVFAKVKDAAEPKPLWLRQSEETGLFEPAEGPEEKADRNRNRVKAILEEHAPAGGIGIAGLLEASGIKSRDTIHGHLRALGAVSTGGTKPKYLPAGVRLSGVSGFQAQDGLKLVERNGIAENDA